MRKLYVPLSTPEFEQLRSIALAERRRPQEQAAVIISGQLAKAATQVQAKRQPVGAAGTSE